VRGPGHQIGVAGRHHHQIRAASSWTCGTCSTSVHTSDATGWWDSAAQVVRADEPQGRLGGHHRDVMSGLGELAQQIRRLVGGNPPSNTQNDPAHEEKLTTNKPPDDERSREEPRPRLPYPRPKPRVEAQSRAQGLDRTTSAVRTVSRRWA